MISIYVDHNKSIVSFSCQITSHPHQSTSETVTVELNTSVTSMSERDDTCSEKDRDSLWDKDRSASRASSSTSAATLTNVS